MLELDPSQLDDLTRVLNSAVVSRHAHSKRDYSQELFDLVKTPGFKAVLGAVHDLAQRQGCSEKDAATQIIETVQKLDGLWGEYLEQEGAKQLGLSN